MMATWAAVAIAGMMLAFVCYALWVAGKNS